MLFFKSEGICKDEDLKQPVQDWVEVLNKNYAAMDTEPVKVGNDNFLLWHLILLEIFIIITVNDCEFANWFCMLSVSRL